MYFEISETMKAALAFKFYYQDATHELNNAELILSNSNFWEDRERTQRESYENISLLSILLTTLLIRSLLDGGISLLKPFFG